MRASYERRDRLEEERDEGLCLRREDFRFDVLGGLVTGICATVNSFVNTRFMRSFITIVSIPTFNSHGYFLTPSTVR